MSPSERPPVAWASGFDSGVVKSSKRASLLKPTTAKLPTRSSIPDGVFRIGRIQKPRVEKFIPSQDARYICDEISGPTLHLNWTKPTLFGRVEVGKFVFGSDVVKIGTVPESQVVFLAKEAASLCLAPPPNVLAVVGSQIMGTGGRVGGGIGALVGGVVGAAVIGVGAVVTETIKATREGKAWQEADDVGMKGLGVYYDTHATEKNLGLFVGIAKAEIVDEIMSHIPSSKVMTFTDA